jgi:simple sugar transport system ATP-binding protein
MADVTVAAGAVSKRYGSTVALDSVDLTVYSGQSRALVGRNGAGKSTLVSILTGLQAPDSGMVSFGGRPAPRLSDRDAWRREVACVYQRSTIIPTLTVAENLFLNRHARTGLGLIRWRALRAAARELLATWSVQVDVAQLAGGLGVEQRQLVEIARALSFGARFIILDEPTAQLDAHAIGRLFARIRQLQEQGVTFLFISHHLQEVYDICDTVTVLRDARQVLTAPVAELPRHELVAAMTGDAAALAATARTRAEVRPAAPVALRVRELTGDTYCGVSFEVRAGEVVGLAGGGASGKTEVAETIAGLRAARAGTVEVAGRQPQPGSVPAAVAAGVGLVPQDRHQQGFVPLLSIAANVTMTVPQRIERHGLINGRLQDDLTRRLTGALSITAPGPDFPVAGLSGGNQQKVVLARALAGNPRLLVLITPTAGVDVRSKQLLLDVVEAASRDGTAVLVASDELDDLRLCDRLLVLFNGRIVRELGSGWPDQDVVSTMEGVDLDRA